MRGPGPHLASRPGMRREARSHEGLAEAALRGSEHGRRRPPRPSAGRDHPPATRGENITVIFINNAIDGMTGRPDGIPTRPAAPGDAEVLMLGHATRTPPGSRPACATSTARPSLDGVAYLERVTSRQTSHKKNVRNGQEGHQEGASSPRSRRGRSDAESEIFGHQLSWRAAPSAEARAMTSSSSPGISPQGRGYLLHGRRGPRCVIINVQLSGGDEHPALDGRDRRATAWASAPAAR